MSEHTSLMSAFASDEEPGPLFDLVRRGYDRDQVDHHLSALEQQLHASESAARQAEQDAALARQELEDGRPDWTAFGERITQILTLAEQEGEEIRRSHSREADELLAGAQQRSHEAEERYAARLAEAEAAAERLVVGAQQRADAILTQTHERAAAAEDESQRRLADLQQQQEAVHAQLARLQEGLAAAVGAAGGVRMPDVAVAEQPRDREYEPTTA